MDCKIIWSAIARNDLKEIYAYYPKNAANKIVSDINIRIQLLSKHPYMAATEPLLEDNPKIYRSLVVAKGLYKILYFENESIIYVTRIWGCRQKPG